MAGRFRFRLEALLRVRRALEDAARRHLARMVAALEMARRKLRDLEAERDGALEARRTPPGEAVDLARLQDLERFLIAQARRIADATELIAMAEAKVAEARAALVKAHREHLILQRLRERRQEQHALEAARDEAIELDEIAVLRHGHPAAARAASALLEATP